MKVRYDNRTNTFTVVFRDDATVVESDEEKPGLILDYDFQGSLVSPEVLDASQRVTEACKMEFHLG